MIGMEEMVPWPQFSANIRFFIETILTQDADTGMSDTKIVIITPPPLNNGPEATLPKEGMMSEREIEEANKWRKEGPRYKTYMSKKRYAEGLMQIAAEYEGTERVIGLDYWRAMVEASGLGRWEEFEETGMWPGCSLIGARSFEKGWFTDGLHLDVKGYNVLNEMVMREVVGKWPELASKRIEKV
jgi:lysophospholipase L1-like esterase